MTERIEIGYVCRQGHFQFKDDPDGDSCGTKDVATIYVESGEYTADYLRPIVEESLTSLHDKIEFWRKNA